MSDNDSATNKAILTKTMIRFDGSNFNRFNKIMVDICTATNLLVYIKKRVDPNEIYTPEDRDDEIGDEAYYKLVDHEEKMQSIKKIWQSFGYASATIATKSDTVW